MASFKIFSQDDILSFVNKRNGETKLGERIDYYRYDGQDHSGTISVVALQRSPAKFVLLGIPEDLGVRANYGVGGTDTAWAPTLKALLNLQQNIFLKGEDVLLLGAFKIPEQPLANLDELRNAVAEIDDLVFPVIQTIIAAGKVPIVIGGGHNNCYPIIKGTSLALGTKINVLNIDAHTDLRNTEEGRHSGNGFSTAIKHGFLAQYRILGLHQNYVSESQLDYISKNNNIKAYYFDDLVSSGQTTHHAAEALLEGVKSPLGLEIDLDSISATLSSAITPSGFALNEIRSLLQRLPQHFHYLHICEGAYLLKDGRRDEMIGKKITYLLSDFMKRAV